MRLTPLDKKTTLSQCGIGLASAGEGGIRACASGRRAMPHDFDGVDFTKRQAANSGVLSSSPAKPNASNSRTRVLIESTSSEQAPVPE
jgi:hypothetical protein